MQFTCSVVAEAARKKNREALNERLPASVICNSGLNYQVSFRPSSTLRLPPLKKVLFKNVGEVTKM